MRGALRCIGQLKPGRGPGPAELIDATYVFNRLLDYLGIDRGNIFTIAINQYPLTAGKQTYQIGSGVIAPDWPGPRPVKIEGAWLIVPTNPGLPLRQPMAVWSDVEYANIKLQQTPSTLPQGLFCDGANPVSNISTWPVESIGGNLVELHTWQTFTQIADITQNLVFPDGYLEMLTYNLAVRLSLEWGRPLNEGVAELARDTLATIQCLNSPHPILELEPIVHGNRSSWNWLTGEC
jgi:hypothetical protein